MNWTPIADEDLKDAKVSALLEAVRTKGIDQYQRDPIPEIIQSVVDRIRRKIGSCRFNKLDIDTTAIPNGLKSMAVFYVLVDLKNRIEDPLTDDEKLTLQRYDKDLDRIASCQDAVEQPDNPTPSPVVQEGNVGTPSISDCPPRRRERRVRG